MPHMARHGPAATKLQPAGPCPARNPMTQRRPSSPSRPAKPSTGRPQRPAIDAADPARLDAPKGTRSDRRSDGPGRPGQPSPRGKAGEAPRKSGNAGREGRPERRPGAGLVPGRGPGRNRRGGEPAVDAQPEVTAVDAQPAQSVHSGEPHMQPGESAMQPGEVRLNKAIAGAGVCSRRQADDLIQQGVVRVNGEVVDTPGARVVPGRDRIEVRGQLLELDAAPTAFTYVMLHKPVQVVSTVRDPQGRPTVLGILPPELRGGRLYPVGRLDYFSEGLLILTDDGDLTNRLTHPRYHLPKVYMVKVRGHVTESTLAPMRQGMTLAEGEKLAPVDVRLLQSDRQASLFEMTLHQGVNRQIRRMCRDLGLTVLLLRRVRQGPLELGELPKGAARRLTPHEVTALRRAAGLES